MLSSKGNDPKNWNWQMRENRTIQEIEEEKEYLEHIEQISHPVVITS